MPSHRITILILSVAVFIIACDGTRGHKKSPKQMLEEKKEQEDSLREAKRAATAHSRYPKAWMWDSLNYRYTYGYQTAIQRQPVVMFNRYSIEDLRLSDSTLHVLCSSGEVHFDIACPAQDSALVRMLVPNREERNNDLTLSQFEDLILPKSRPWLIIEVKDIMWVDKPRNNWLDDDPSPSVRLCLGDRYPNFNGILVDVID